MFAQGIVVNVLNPKTALFFLAFLPQFVDPDRGHATLQIALLGCTFAVLGMVTDSVWAVGAGAAGDVLRRSRRFAQVQRYVSGSVFVGLGVVTALAGTGSVENEAPSCSRLGSPHAPMARSRACCDSRPRGRLKGRLRRTGCARG